jgi:hypothetical protein
LKESNKEKSKNGVEGIPGRNKKRAILFYPLSLSSDKNDDDVVLLVTHTLDWMILYIDPCVCVCVQSPCRGRAQLDPLCDEGIGGGATHTHTEKDKPKMEGEHMKRMTNWSGKNLVFSV